LLIFLSILLGLIEACIVALALYRDDVQRGIELSIAAAV
jgi:hypothetical protein